MIPSWQEIEAFYLDEKMRQGIFPSKNTIKNFKSRYKVLFAPYFESKKITQITLDEWSRYVLQNNPTGSNTSFILMRIILRLIKKDKKLFLNYRSAKQNKKVKIALTDDEIVRLANVDVRRYHTSTEAAENLRDKTVILLMGCTGFRISTLKELRYDDIVNGEFIRVRKEISKNREEYIVPVPPHIMALIDQLPKRPSGRIFDGYKGKLDPRTMNKKLRMRGKIAGINHVYLHNHLLRSTPPTEFIRNRESATAICKFMGWKDLNMIRHYEGMVLDDLKQMQSRRKMNRNYMTYDNSVEYLQRTYEDLKTTPCLVTTKEYRTSNGKRGFSIAVEEI